MEIAKALILAGRGDDDHPWPTAPSAPRHLFPIANRPILFHNLESLRRAGTLDRTMLVVLADHGEMIGEHEDFGHGAALYQPAVRVPLVIRV